MRAVLLCVILNGAFASALSAEGPNPRVTPVVQAIQKTRAGVVAVHVDRSSGPRSFGTGVIVDELGHIVTSHHLTAESKRIRVRLADESECTANIVAEDRDNDLTLLRVESKKPLAPLPPGSGGDLLIGETVIAVGHPLGSGYSVSQGIISALDREITLPSGAALSKLIQTDASISPGFSGGPLLNINGEWIGLTVALRESARGIAYVHNIETVKRHLKKHLPAAQSVAVRRTATKRQ